MCRGCMVGMAKARNTQFFAAKIACAFESTRKQQNFALCFGCSFLLPLALLAVRPKLPILTVLSSQSHYVSLSCALRHFYLTEFDIWTGFELVGSTEKCLTYYQLLLKKFPRIKVKTNLIGKRNIQLCFALLEIPHRATYV